MIAYLRSLLALWLLDKAMTVAAEPEKRLITQGVYLITKALVDGMKDIPATAWVAK